MDPDAIKQFVDIVDKFKTTVPNCNDPNGDLQDLSDLLEDLAIAFSDKNTADAKKIIQSVGSALKRLRSSRPELADSIQQLMDMFDKLKTGVGFNSGDFLKKLNSVLNQLCKKGIASKLQRKTNQSGSNTFSISGGFASKQRSFRSDLNL